MRSEKDMEEIVSIDEAEEEAEIEQPQTPDYSEEIQP